jgi:hypothetical protein
MEQLFVLPVQPIVQCTEDCALPSMTQPWI